MSTAHSLVLSRAQRYAAQQFLALGARKLAHKAGRGSLQQQTTAAGRDYGTLVETGLENTRLSLLLHLLPRALLLNNDPSKAHPTSEMPFPPLFPRQSRQWRTCRGC